MEIKSISVIGAGVMGRLNILTFLHQTLGEKFQPCPLLVEYVKAGRLGKKREGGCMNIQPDLFSLIRFLILFNL